MGAKAATGLAGKLLMPQAPAAPAAPDYTGAATATAEGNLKAAQAAASANRVNQVTPQGNLTYTQSGKDAQGNPTYTATQSYSPDQQKLYDQTTNAQIGLGQLANQGLGQVRDALNNPINMASLPANMVNAGQTGQEALMARYQPMIDQQHKSLENQLANQGVMQGSEAYDNAMRAQNQSENDLRSQAALNGINVGQNAQNQQLALQTQLQNQPINMLNAVMSGSQVSSPSFVNAPQQATTGGADYSGALGNQNQYNMGLYNSKVAQGNSNRDAVLGLAQTGAMMFSDIRLKMDITKIAMLDNGLPLYTFRYISDKPDSELRVGVMAQDVLPLIPDAVSVGDDGFMSVDYSKIGGF
jgi:hypothetical protein